MISGLFEIHITVSENELHRFKLYTLDNNYKFIYIIGSNGNQLMLSKYLHSTYDNCINEAKKISLDLIIKKFNVIRIKVEVVGSIVSPEFDKLPGYFEYHIKYPCKNSKEYEKLEQLSADIINIHKCKSFISYSLKKDFKVLLTIKTPVCKGYINANLLKESVLEYVGENGFINEGIVFERVMYDDNEELDEN